MDTDKLKQYVEETQPILESYVKMAEAVEKELPGVLNVLTANGILNETVKEATADKIRKNPAEALGLIRKIAAEVVTDRIGDLSTKTKDTKELSGMDAVRQQFERAILG